MTLAQAFDSWQRRYETHPDDFGNSLQNVRDRRKRARKHRASKYGVESAQLIRALMKYGRKAWR